MLHTGKLIIAVAVATLALPAAAGNSWPQVPSRPTAKTAQLAPVQFSTARAPQSSVTASTATKDAYAGNGAVNGFEYVGGDGGWQVVEHKYVLSNGRFVHSDECDHAIRSAQAVTPADVAATKMPGA